MKNTCKIRVIKTTFPGRKIDHNGNDIGVLLIYGFIATTVEVRFLADRFIK